MQRYVNSTIDVILDRTADQLIAGLLVALVLALVLAGLFALLRRKISDATVLITCLALLTNLVGMTLAAGFIRTTTRQTVRPLDVRDPFVPRVGGGGALARTIFERADTNRDGVLSAREAAVAAERYIQEAEAIEGGPINEGLLRGALRRVIGPSPEMFAPPHLFEEPARRRLEIPRPGPPSDLAPPPPTEAPPAAPRRP